MTLLYQEFEAQAALEEERGLPVSCLRKGSEAKYAGNNVWFLEHMVLPLFRSISDISNSFGELVERILANRDYWKGRVQTVSDS